MKFFVFWLEGKWAIDAENSYCVAHRIALETSSTNRCEILKAAVKFGIYVMKSVVPFLLQHRKL
jgi:ribosomal protein L32E